jgi:predicted  nucleic acid-binding Zn-ribbon protein
VNRVGTSAGLHRFDWDLRQRGATDFPGMIFWAAGTLSPPGTYRVRLTVDGQELAETFTVRRAANFGHVSNADLQAQHELASAIRDRTSEANEAVVRIRDVKRQIEERLTQTQDRGMTGAAEKRAARLSAVEGAIYQVRLEARQDPSNYPIRLNDKIAALLGQVDGAAAPPTDQQREIFAELSKELDAELARMRDALGSGLTEVNRLLERERLAPIAVR